MQLKRWTGFLALMALGVVGMATPAQARAPGDHCANNPDSIACGGTAIDTTSSEDTDSDGGGGTGGPAIPVDYERFFNEDGTTENLEPGFEQGCWGIRTVPQGEGMDFGAAQDLQANVGENAGLWDTCPLEDTIDAAELAKLIWETTVRPPPPMPIQVQPGRAVTGLRAYLEIGGEVPARQTVGTPLGPATFTMTPRYVVTWGDGASAETESQGVPWPGGAGEITHVYRDAGGVTVTVQAFWRSTWTLAGQGGDLAELAVPTEGGLDLPVEEYQVTTD